MVIQAPGKQPPPTNRNAAIGGGIFTKLFGGGGTQVSRSNGQSVLGGCPSAKSSQDVEPAANPFSGFNKEGSAHTFDHGKSSYRNSGGGGASGAVAKGAGTPSGYGRSESLYSNIGPQVKRNHAKKTDDVDIFIPY